jgi:hypothetical protein
MSSTLWTYNQIIQRLEVFAEGHYFLASFTHGQIDVKNLEKFPTYPHMHVIPEGFDYGPQEKTFNFRVLVFDKPRQVEEKPDYQKEVISDTQQVIEDLVYELKNGRTLFGKEVDTPESFSITAFMESFENVVTGCEAVISITVPNQWSACNIPANWALSGSGSKTSPAYGGLVLRTDGVNNAVQNILDLVEGSNITITDLGDGRVRIAATGGGGGGLTCDDLTTCQTILDILQSITDVDRDLTTLSNAFTAHVNNTSNPHSTTKAQVGLSDVDNTSDVNKPVSTAQAAADAAVLVSANAYTDAAVAALDGGMVDWSADCSPTGFASFTEKFFRYNRMLGSKMCHFTTRVFGPASGTGATIILPFNAANTHIQRIAMNVLSNNANSVGYMSTVAGSNIAAITLGTGGALSASTTKGFTGNGVFETE